jgi:hypothetical protein
MPEPPPGMKTSLHAIAQVLRTSPPLGPEAQRALADLIDEAADALGASAIPPAQVTHLTESTAHFLQTVHSGQDKKAVASAATRLEEALLAAEAYTPLASDFARRILDALANIGI